MTGSLHALSGAYVIDALDDAERAAFERHLAQCPDCQREVASLREATALMFDDAALTPPPSLRASVLAGITAIRPIPPQPGEQSEPDTAATVPAVAKVLPMRPRRRRIAGLVAAAAAILAVGAGTVYQPWADPDTTQLSAADQVLAAFDAQHSSIEFDDGSSATVVRSMKEGRAVLLTRGMDAPPPGKAFEVWLQDESGKMIPAGMMRKAGDHKLLLKGNAAKANGVGITIEPESGSKTPTTKPIAQFEFRDA